ncbi:MAG: GAF domain-containing protein [Reyranella sp.]|uniref:GAF domain-containing protein n=1 Tax=Reyranella sp. TaxID=1929291 RepID=UPI0027304462|nr:GAF domain-containing protein [Reyranella sp.]MDP1960928.1 GAF domain-containing protein [Reyranella sp.]MDP2376572.1 GAF domain-containing protein [Reyranella sp.]
MPIPQAGARPVAPRWLDHSRWLFVALCIGGVGYTFAAAWLVTAGSPDPITHTAEFLALLVTPWMMADYAVALALIAFGIWYLRTSPGRAADAPDVEAAMKRQAIRLTVILLVVAASLVSIGVLYFTDLMNASRAERASQQESVARLKAQQIDKWLLERTIDAEFLATTLRGLPLERLPSDRDARLGIELLFAQVLAGNTERVSVSLFAPDGRVLVHAGEGSAPDREIAQAAQAAAIHPGQRQSIVDVHLDGTPPRPRMVFVVPVTERPGSGPMMAVLAMAIDPFDALFPQIQAWPTPSASSEAVVVRREGDDVVFITPPPLLEPVPAPLAFRAPLASNRLPSAEAVMTGDAVRTGPDYRGVDVLTASRRVTGVPWVVVAKTDLEEIARPLQRKELMLILVIGAAIVLAAFMLLVLWRSEYASLLAFHDQKSEEQTAMSRHFEQLVRMARDIVLLIRPDGMIIEANEAAAAAYGYSAAELRGLDVRDLLPTEELAHFEAVWNAPDPPGGLLVEGVNRRRDGTVFPVEISGRAIEVDGKIYRQSFIRDITRRKELEREVARLSNVKAALQAATSVLLRARSETELFQEMCEILVQVGGFRMANVAIPNDDAGRTVRFLAIAGVEDGYLARAAISWGEGPRSRGPTGGALRTGEVQVNQDFAVNPTVAPWREEALKHGYQASIGLPLRVDGKVFAALALYAGQSNAFDEEERALLVALAEDVSYAVLRLRRP